MSTKDPVDFLIQRDDLHQVKFDKPALPAPADLPDGGAILRVDAFAFTANNITYALLGDTDLKYWDFFPAPEGYGRLPVWGFADVVESRNDQLIEGERFYGFLPLGSHMVVRTDKANDKGFIETSPHRTKLPALYNNYSRVKADPAYDAAFEAEHMLLNPLFGTAFLLKNWLEMNEFFGAEAILFSSASAKTAFATARLLHAAGSPPLIGLTSARNIDFVKGLGSYAECFDYEHIVDIAGDRKIVFMDFAGNQDILRKVHEHFGENLVYSNRIGSTHPGKQTAAPDDLPGAAPKVFFAPLQFRNVQKKVGVREFQEQYGKAWVDFRAAASDWIRPERDQGEDAVRRIYLENLQGKARADLGYILSL